MDCLIGEFAPGLPLVLAGPRGCGRTVLALQLAAAGLAQREIVAFVTAEPPGLLLRQAETLGLDLEAGVRAGQLLLLELDPRATASLQGVGAKGFVEAIHAEHPAVARIVVDPVTALTRDILDESALRTIARDMVAATPRASLVLTVETGIAGAETPIDRVLEEVCGAFLELDRAADGRRIVSVAKTRAGPGSAESVEFEIGPGGAEVVRELRVERSAEPRATRTAPDAGGEHGRRPRRARRSRRRGRRRPEPRRERPCVLLVDADDGRRAELVSWLEDRYEVVAAKDGFDAIASRLCEQPDVIAIDLHMPRISGFEVLTALHRAADWIPILAITGTFVRTGDRIGPLVLGAADAIAQPIQRFEFLHKIETLLRLEGPPPAMLEPEAANALFGTFSDSRLLTVESFEERLARACDFGERYGIPSALVAVTAPSADVLDRFVSAAEAALRYEDAVLLASKKRALVLLVAADLDQAPKVMERLERRTGAGLRRSGLRWKAMEAVRANEIADWRPCFRRLEDAPEGSGDDDAVDGDAGHGSRE